MVSYPVSASTPVPTSSLPPEKILSIITAPPPASSSRVSLPKLLALLVLLAFFLLRLFTFYYQNLYDLSSSHGPATPPVHPTIGISLSRTCSEAGYEPFEVDFRHDPSEASPGWRRIPWPESSPWEERDGEEEGGDWYKRGGEEVDWDGEGVWAEPNAGDLVSRIVERMEHASAFLEKTVTRAVVSVPSEWSFETLEKIRRDLPSLLPSNLKVTLQPHYVSALQLLPLPSPRWITKDNDTWTSSILVVDANKEWGNTTLALVRTRDQGYDVMGVRTLTAYCGLYEDETEVRMTNWEPEQLGRELDGLLRDVRVGRTRLKREDVDVIVLTSSHHRNLTSLQTILESAFVNNTKVKINPFDFPPEEVLVRGASRSAMFQEAVESWGDTCSMTVDWNPFALGLTDQNGAFHQIKDVGNPYQIQPDLTITTTDDEQTSLALEISEYIPQENATLSIGHVVLTGLAPRPAGVLQLHIDLRLDEDQRTIEVVARSTPHSPKFSQVLELRSKKDFPSHSGWKETVPSSRSDL